tara:strand:- start:284 stop:592 length:309 start_codon:yes stop_codon:yes gene_type:complete
MGGAASSQTPVSASAVGTTGLSKGYMDAQVKEWEAQMAMVGSQAETVAVKTKEETPEEETSPVKVGYMAAEVRAWEEAQKQAAIGQDSCGCCDNDSDEEGSE